MGRRVFGVAAIALGAASLFLHHQLASEWRLPGVAAFLFVTSIALIAGGGAMQFRHADRLGAAILGGVYLLYALTLVPDIFARPGLYASWGNVFYGLALVAGALVAYGLAAPAAPYAKAMCNAGVLLLGLCNISFAIEQVEFLARTVSLVPRWVPPNAMFWAIATTIAFALAGVSLLTRYKSLLAAQLLTLMLLIFVVLIWIPLLIAHPEVLSNWSEGIETFAIAGAAWIIADFLAHPLTSR
ncbi:MAG TPA: hypothetical protein VGI19_07090 [Candidatus Cybelea sp.]|jgi:hypothetical protein